MRHNKIGILGAGQLGMMLAQAAKALGKECKFLAHGHETSCIGLGQIVTGNWNDSEVIGNFLSDLALVTYEFENTPVDLANFIEKNLALYPNSRALSVSQDRISEKDLFRKLGIATPNYLAVDSPQDLELVTSELGFPCVLKTRRLGYDGKGQCIVHDKSQLTQAFAQLGAKSLIAEQFVKFERELSIIAVRNLEGQTRYFPITKNTHREGILRVSVVYPDLIDTQTTQTAQRFSNALINELNYVGVMALELFQTSSGLLANEIAPRVHNTGHWSMDGASMSQFEAHIRAISGESLPEITLLSPSAMINLIGDTQHLNDSFSGLIKRVHLYNKEPRPGRKLGHINLLTQDSHALLDVVSRYVG